MTFQVKSYSEWNGVNKPIFDQVHYKGSYCEQCEQVQANKQLLTKKK